LALDVFTLFLIAGLVISLCGGLLLLTRERGGGMDPLAWWAVAMLLGGVGVLLLGGSRRLPELLWSDLSRALMLLAGGTSWTAARVFSGRRPMLAVAAAGGVLWMAAYQVPGFGDAPAMQTSTASLVAAVYMLATAAELWRGRAEYLPSRLPAIVLLAIHVATLVVRGWPGLGDGRPGVQAGLTLALLLESMAHTIGMAFLLLALTKDRAQALALASVAAERRSNTARARFLAHMSHELRTPLNGVLGFAQVLARDPSLSETQRTRVDLLERAGRHLLSLANDALDLMRIDAGRLELDTKPIDLAEALETCVGILQPRAVEEGVDLVLELADDLPRRVLGDRTRLQQVMLNLLSNAVKFTPPEGRVRLVAAAGASFGLHLEVVDTGPGVPEDKRAQLFQDFTQLAPSSTDPSEGVGLGLAICAGIVQAMGGTIGYTPGPRGIGACFQVELPWRPLPRVREVPVVAPVGEGRKLRVLAVDDVRSNRLLLQAMLEAEGHSVVLAESGAAGLALVAAAGFDAVLMDVRMPDLDGLEVTRRIRGLPGAAGQTPIIGVSADAARHNVAACLDAGMNGHVGKPFERGQLLAALRQVTCDDETALPSAD
jgi:signal transduction histidine kinase/ActR/RegA family two-component response regulator